MNSKIKNIFFNASKAFTNSTVSRKKKISYTKAKKLRNINLKFKLQLLTYNKLSQIQKYIAVPQNYKSNFNFLSIFF